MFNVANTLHESVVSEILKHAHMQRHSLESSNAEKESIMMSEHWKQELKSLPLASRVS